MDAKGALQREWHGGSPAHESNGSTVREVQVDTETRRKPRVVARLNDWQYLERALHRLVAGWGRCFPHWNDKVTVHRHVWEQAECVRRLRERLAQFPGTTANTEAPVSKSLERLANAVLQAPSHEDAVDGIYQLLTGALVKSYLGYAQATHQIHDAPTVSMLHEIIGIKESQRLWLRDYRRRHPHKINEDYRAAIERELEACGELKEPLPVGNDEAASPAGLGIGFGLPLYPARPATWKPQRNFMPYVEADFATSIEARRLFWCYGYMLEMGLAEEMLRWIYDGHFMPWEWLHAVSRHLWDESRHGDSGHSRLLDFGITVEDIGFPSPEGSFTFDLERKAPPMTPQELYNAAFFIGMVAETGHFHVKNEAYDDFKAGGDLESAEMMLFDIIDEGAHVQYAHEWLPVLAERAGVDHSDYRERGVQKRRELQEANDLKVEQAAQLPRDMSNPDYAFYQQLLQTMRDRVPLSNAATCPPRSSKPM